MKWDTFNTIFNTRTCLCRCAPVQTQVFMVSEWKRNFIFDVPIYIFFIFIIPEAIGDTIALSVASPHHLQRINLLNNYNDTFEDNINALYSEALARVAFLPFGLLIDKWRWDVFNHTVPESQWNEHWWNLREKYQKVSPPTARNESFFDPGAKFHVPASVPYISYFVSHLLEFQFYRSLCIEANQYDPNNPSAQPLHKCDFYQSKEAGKKLA